MSSSLGGAPKFGRGLSCSDDTSSRETVAQKCLGVLEAVDNLAGLRMGNQCQNGTYGNSNYNNYNRFQNEGMASRYDDGEDSEDCYSGSSRSSFADLLRQGLKPTLISVLGQKTPDVTEHYTLGRKLGQGEFGTTYLCTEISTGCQYACKSILKSQFENMQDIEDVRREIQIMHHLSGQKNIVTIKDAYEDEKAVHIVMELCAGGELFNRIQKGNYSERKAAELIRIIVGIIAKCHSLGVMHRDLKPENFLLQDKEDDLSIKLIDFGVSVFFKPGQVFTDLVGSPYYIAPEVLRKHYGPEADVWTAGVILYVLLSGVPPFWAETRKRIYDKIEEGHFDFESNQWHRISDSAKDLIRKMLCPCPSERLKAHEVLNHPWICNDGVATGQALEPTVLSRLEKLSETNKLKKLDLQADSDNNTNINWKDFIAATVPLNKKERNEQLVEAFTYFDKDMIVDKLQIPCVEGNTEDTCFEEMIQNNDGQIDYAEFVPTMQSNSSGHGWQALESSLNVPLREAPRVY
ncbi:hypothetical protein ACP70R_019565 [Stipagrostis hirtigluma subsp. patula]